MTKTKSQKARSKACRKVAVAVPVQGQRGKKKRWEFNLVKTGNIAANYQSTAAGNINKSMVPSAQPRKVRDVSLQPGTKMGSQVQDEFISLVNGVTSFAAVAFPIQPGLASTFPWLSKIAKLYERYVVEDMEFYFKPTVSPYAAGGQTGKVVLLADYDASSAPPETIQGAETTDPHVDGMPYETVTLRLDPRRLTPNGGKFTRDRFVPGTDIKTYDAGNFYICVAGTAATSQIGELRVRYSVRFLNPRITEIALKPCNCAASFAIPDNTPETSGAILTGWSAYINPLGITESGGVFTLPPGTYFISFAGTFSASSGFLIQYASMILWYTDAGGAVLQGSTRTDLGAATANVLGATSVALVTLPAQTRIQVNCQAITTGGFRTANAAEIIFHMI